MAFYLNVKLATGHCGDNFSRNDSLNTEICQGSAKNSAAEHDVLGSKFEILRRVGDLAKESEGVILKNVDSLMICPQIVDLLFEDCAPEVRAKKFNPVKFIFESRHFAC
jgi:hypothetical protein